MANGILNIWGTQYGIPPGNWKDQLSIPYSAIAAVFDIPISQTNEALYTPNGAQGFIIIPASLGGGTASIKFGFATSTENFVSPVYPTVIALDSANFPEFVYLTTSAYCSATVRFF